MKSLARALVLEERIETSEAKAKELRPMIEKMVTKAKESNLSQIRANAVILGVDGEKKLRENIAPIFKDREGGYTRIVKLSQVRSDASKQAIIEFVK
jgi:large subunit ribosomal protein L17